MHMSHLQEQISNEMYNIEVAVNEFRNAMYARVDQAAEELLHCASTATQRHLEFCDGVDADIHVLKQLMEKAALIQNLLQAFSNTASHSDATSRSFVAPAPVANRVRSSDSKQSADIRVCKEPEVMAPVAPLDSSRVDISNKRRVESFPVQDENRFPGLLLNNAADTTTTSTTTSTTTGGLLKGGALKTDGGMSVPTSPSHRVDNIYGSSISTNTADGGTAKRRKQTFRVPVTAAGDSEDNNTNDGAIDN